MNTATAATNRPSASMLMFGVDDIDHWYSFQERLYDLNTSEERKMNVMGMLSDVQEMISRGNYVDANHTLNRAKWMIRNKI